MRKIILIIVVTVSTLGGNAVRAQEDRLATFERQLELIRRDTKLTPNPDVPAGQRMMLDYGGSLSFIFAVIEDREGHTHTLRQTDLVGYVSADLDGVHQFFLRGRTTYRDFNAGDSFDGHGDDWVEPQVDRLTYRFNLQRFMAANQGKQIDWNATIQVGRQLVHWANGLTLSEELDGAVLTLTAGKTDLELLAGRTRESVVDFDSSRPGFDGDTDRRFYGAMLSHQATARHRPFVYGLVQRDHNDADPVTGPAFGTIEFDYNSWYFGIGSRGSFTDRLVYGVELVYEGGEGRSGDGDFSQSPAIAAPPTEEDISAWALDLRLDYLIPDARHTRLSAELLLASGDDDRFSSSDTVLGNAPGTDDNAFNAFGLIDTGLAFAPEPSNLAMLRLGASTFPCLNHDLLRRLQVGTNLYLFWKLDSDGGFDEPTSNDSYLGTEVDVYANWRLTSDLALTARYGVFFPGPAIADSTNNAEGDPRQFLFTGVTLAF